MTIVDMETKTCTRCGETKPREAFSRDARRRDGLRPNCKACNAAYRAAYRAANPDAIKARAAAYRAAHPDAIKARRSTYYVANHDAIKARKATYRASLKARPDDVITAAQAENVDARARVASAA